MKSTRQRGSQWEQVAESFLHARGLKTRERNFQARFGEIDLVMLDGDTLVFAEVRYRENGRHGTGAESVTRAKQRRIVSTAGLYLQRRPADSFRPCRFDVISIGAEDGETLIDWVRNAFDAG